MVREKIKAKNKNYKILNSLEPIMEYVVMLSVMDLVSHG